MAVDRLNHCENIVELAKELGISRRLLYGWREKLAALDCSGAPPATAREATLRKEVRRLKRVLAEKVLEVDCFTGALQHVEARRQRSGKTGARASPPRSGR
jgi:transposase-like protein